jgi:hypothetical protein
MISAKAGNFRISKSQIENRKSKTAPGNLGG